MNDEDVPVFMNNRGFMIALRPGLKINITNGYGSVDTLVMEMPDAMTFGLQLRELMRGSTQVALVNKI